MKARFPTTILAVTLFLSGLVAGTANAVPSGPPLQVTPQKAATTLQCPHGFTHPGRQVVLLVHGTGGTGPEHFGTGVGPLLTRTGFDWCMVNSPDYETGDAQTNAEYVVAGVRSLAARTGRKVSLVGYSQGAVLARWAVRWWPDVRASVDRLISLEGANQGSLTSSAICAVGSCAPAAWQLRPDSKLITALNRVPRPSGPRYTAIGSLSDETVRPLFSGSPYFIPGGRSGNVLVQDVYPGRVVTHGQAVYDAVTLAIISRALSATRPVRASDIDRRTCSRLFAPGIDDGAATASIAAIYADGLQRAAITAPRVDREPPLRSYAR